MYIYIYIYLYIYFFFFMYVCIYIYICIYVYTYKYIHQSSQNIHIYIHIYINKYINLCVYVCMYICKYKCYHGYIDLDRHIAGSMRYKTVLCLMIDYISTTLLWISLGLKSPHREVTEIFSPIYLYICSHIFVYIRITYVQYSKYGIRA
jgi:hypothetical protein